MREQKPIMLYLNDAQAEQLAYLMEHFSSDAVRAGVSHVMRLALETLYSQVISLEKEE
jgi:hypothetical protein